MARTTSVPRFWRLAVLACLLVLLAAPEVADARTLILRSSGPSASQLRPGKLLAEPVELQLVDGDRLTILDELGTRELRGPATISERAPRRSAAAERITWDRVLEGWRRERAAGVRGIDDAPPLSPPQTSQSDLWLIDAMVGGHWCTLNLGDVALWRGDASKAVEVTIRGRDQRAAATWHKGDGELKWPSTFLLNDEVSFSLQLNRSSPKTFFVHQVEAGESIEALANQFVENRCYQQLGILLLH